MALLQNECYRVVTIGYLKELIMDGEEFLIQDSKGNGVGIDYEDDAYCPTYSELTGGTFIQIWEENSQSPIGDRDGIVVSPTAIIGGTYAEDQVVDQKDVTVKYTRFNALSVSANKTSGLSQCGESVALTTTYNYKRYTKAMADCPSERPITYTTTSTTVNAPCTDLVWFTDFTNLLSSGSSVTDCGIYTIGKNGSKEAPERCDYVSAATTFRSSVNYNVASNKLKMCQNALTGSYSEEVSGSYRKVRTSLTCTATPSSRKVYGTFDSVSCVSKVNSTVSLAGVGYYDEYKTYAWKEDVCDVINWEDTQERKITSQASESVTTKSYTFKFNNECCDGGSTVKKSLSLTYGDITCSKTFSAITESCSSQTCCQDPTCCKIIGASSVGCSGQVQYKVVDCAEPEECSYIIVDGTKKYNETTWTDSSRITTEGRFTAEVYDGIPSGIINNADDLHSEAKLNQAMSAATRTWMLPYSSSRTGTISNGGVTLTVGINFQDDSHWQHNPCQAAELQWQAGLISKPECIGHHCRWDCWNGSDPCDDICRDQTYITGDTNLGEANYTITSTGASAGRLIIIYWYPSGGEDTYKMCPSKRNICYLSQ